MEFLGGAVLVVFLGFLAYQLGFLSVHKRADKPASSGSGGGSKPNYRDR